MYDVLVSDKMSESIIGSSGRGQYRYENRLFQNVCHEIQHNIKCVVNIIISAKINYKVCYFISDTTSNLNNLGISVSV